MAKKCVLNVMEKPVSPSHMCMEHWSSSVLKNTFSSSLVFPQKDKEKEGMRLTHSPYRQFKRAQRIVSTSPHQDVRSVVLIGSGNQDNRKISQSQLFHCSWPRSNIAIIGSPVSLSLRPHSQLNRASQLRVKLPQLAQPGSRDGENSVRKQCILTAIKPSNVESEKAKFFKSDFRYDPQFEYSNPASPQVLEKHSKASDRFLTQAVRIIELALNTYGNYEEFEQTTGGSLLTKSRIWAHIKKYMEKEGCVGEIVVHLTDDLLSRASMTIVNGRPTLTINIAMAREQWLEGMLRHEIGTHYFRSINNSQQPWNSPAKRKKLGLKPVNPTEEGLASIHSVLFNRDPRLWRAALLYYTVHQAAHMSFSQLFHELARFVHDPGTRWEYCVRAKRGQTDTSQPGCFNKDQVYLDGILKLLRHREKIDFQLLTALGKVSYEDMERLKSLAVMENVRIPHFLQDQARYDKQLQKIMKVNQLTDEELQALM
ncbi:putative tyrosine carboxypeptidase MATCAP2 [Neoarius graeffei]|uniref:putative tyrosine carboxypeptidase MATCAP2 n=1 Tax=Neoarius graeffei TaxID=443677 RepID=UPI00298CA6D0|nr:putative tyrosine carboxypeptidase MATCAP2 [Neoarius graeffei]